MSTLSVCMIVKNEEEFLAGCLDSVKAIADEIVIVDTGSEDKTIEIAESYGARVYHHPWEGDLSKARNQSLEYAIYDWIMIIDGDEELDQADIPVAKMLMENSDFDGLSCWTLSANGPDGTAAHPLPRFFRNGKGHYKGIIHNQCVIHGRVVPALIRFHHHGYNLSPEKMMKKWKRSEALLLKAIEDDRSDTYSWRNLIRNYRAQRDYEKVIATAQEVMGILAREEAEISHTSWQIIMTDWAAAYHGMEQHKLAEGTFKQLLEQYPNNIDGNFMLAELYRGTERHDLAIGYYEAYIKFLQQAKFNLVMDPIIVDTWGATVKAFWAMAECYKAIGELDKAWMALRTFMLQKYETHLDNCIKFAKELELIGGESEDRFGKLEIVPNNQGGMERSNVRL